MSEFNTSFDAFAEEYDKSMGDTGDYSHQYTIDPALFGLIGNVKGLKVYDIACGNGYIARRIANSGANEIWASDISPSLINIARTKYPPLGIKYFVRDANDFTDIQEEYFDLVVMNMAVHYIPDLNLFFQGVSKILNNRGRFVFSLDHPLYAVAYQAFGFAPDIIGQAEKYREERLTTTLNHWTNEENSLPIWRRPFGIYINAASTHGLLTNRVIEPPSRAKIADQEIQSEIPFKMAMEMIKV